MSRIYIDKYTGRLERSDLYLVRMIERNGTIHDNLEPRRLFPFTNQNMFITLLDENEKEIGFVRDLEELDPESKKVLESCFKEYYMIPKIIKLTHCEDKFGILKWTAETDRGTVTFSIRNRHSDIKHLYGTNRVIIRDSNDNRYEIRDYNAMDAHSTHLLFSYL